MTIPTYHRPEGLATALRSVTADAGADAQRIQLVVTDNSTDSRCERVAAEVFDAWPGPTAYLRHDPSRGRTENQNSCIELATGAWQYILHDDDYLLDGGLRRVLDAIRAADDDERVMLFGVRVVDERGGLRRHQRFAARRRLGPAEALRRLLTGSSFVRMPAIVVRRDAYAEVGPFDASLRNVDDYDMWIRLFARYGVTTVPSTISAYVIHSDAVSEGMFDVEGIEQLHELYRRAERTRVLPADELRHRKQAYLHQFILAGCFRQLQRRNWHGARDVLGLFALPDVAALGWSPRWAAVRAAFTAAAVVGGRVSSRRSGHSRRSAP